jgi:hypothetical protein
MPDSAADIQNTLRTKLTQIQEDRVHTYAILLGRQVIDTMLKTIGDDNAVQFLEALEKFGQLLDASQEVDLFTMIPVHQLMAFNDFDQYLRLLSSLQQKLKMMATEQEAVKPLLAAIDTVLEIGSKKAEPVAEEAAAAPAVPAADGEARTAEVTEAPATATAASGKKQKPVFGDTRFRGISLPSVPLSYLDRDNLPKTFPDYTSIRGIVVARFNKSEIRTKLYRDLNACLSKSLKAVALNRKYTEQVTTDPRDYIAEAQQYLMDHNWIGYGLDPKQLAVASDRLDRAGIPNLVDYTDGVLVVASERTSAYAFLGVNLELILREAIFALVNDVRANYTFDGKQSALAVIVAACSSAIQEAARLWLEKVQDAFNDNAESANG